MTAAASERPNDDLLSPALRQELAAWRVEAECELLDDILPFWLRYAVDYEHGGFVGALTLDLAVRNEVPRSGVLCARILWTFAAAYRRYGLPEYLALAQRAYAYLTGPFWDEAHPGIYWSIDAHGRPVSARKHSYCQAFAIYGLCEYYRATGDPAALDRAQVLFGQLERHAHDPVYGGYIEGCGPAWDTLDDMRLSELEPNCRKSMNTLLHILEAYTNLLRVWEEPLLRRRLTELLALFATHVIDPQAHRFRLFFHADWRALPDAVSYGHDIEGSWLLVEAAAVLDDPAWTAHMQTEGVLMAEAVRQGGLGPDGSVAYERRLDGNEGGSVDYTKNWWAQAEGAVGFVAAYQLVRDPALLAAAQGCRRVINDQFLDRTHGEWYKVILPDGTLKPGQFKIGPWECPYHHARMCMELVERLGALLEEG